MRRYLTTATAPEWFWGRADQTGECWLWAGPFSRRGYGQVYIDGHTRFAHRTAWELTYGSISDGLYVCHKCDTPPCIRPDHLFLGTALENNRDKIRKGRAPDGERHGRSKLTEIQVIEIRARWAAGGIRQIDLAHEYGVSKAAIWYALQGQTWDHVIAPSLA